MALLLSLPVSLLVSTLRLDITTRMALLATPEISDQSSDLVSESINSDRHFIMHLLSQSRNLTISERNGNLFTDSLLIASLDNNTVNTLNIKCSNDISLRITMNNNISKTILSPSLCRQNSQLKVQIGGIKEDQEWYFNGCVGNVTIAGEVLLDRWCSSEKSQQKQQQQKDANKQSDGPRPPPHYVERSHFTEPLILDEGAIVPIQRRNIYLFSRHHYGNISKGDILFRVLEAPQHGQLLKYSQPINQFVISDILANKIFYKHDDSETITDNIGLEAMIISQEAVASKRKMIYNIPIRINPVNDAPELKPGTDYEALWITGDSKLKLDSRAISLWDADSNPETVYVSVVATDGVRLENSEKKEIRKFTQRDFLKNDIYVIPTGRVSQKGTLKLIASDGENQSDVLQLTIYFAPIQMQLKANTGLKVIHQTAGIISSTNLSFTTNLPGIPIEYTIVDQPEYGVVQCRHGLGQFQICSTFTQNDIDSSRVQYKHSSAMHPLLDTFSFQIRVDTITSMIHVFRITFIPVHVKIFNRIPFLLNDTDNLPLKRENLFAWTFPKSFLTNQLVYHIIEPPKFGTLLRRIENNRNRRIGVSSNFTQKHIDDSDITYKMNFMQYSIVNDFFTFRLITPSVISEEILFEITFIPGRDSVQLINRTVIVEEGGIQKITNESLSLLTLDSSDFVFTIGNAPLYGNILVKKATGKQLKLANGDNFTTSDINNGNVFYKHMDGENRIDKVLLLAESVYQRTSRVPFWLTIRLILKNDNIPRLVGNNIIQITERGDRTLHPSLLPWVDDDIDAQPLQFTFHDNFRYATILSKFPPFAPLHSFTQRQMQHGEILIRHFGYNKKFKMNYTVSDGVHEVRSVVVINASEPFIWIQNSNITISITDTTTASILVPLTNRNLSAITNIDRKNSDIWFQVPAGNWIFVSNSTKKLVKNFTQQDIDDGRILYHITTPSFDDSENEQIITATVANLTIVEIFKVLKTKLDSHGRHHLEMRTLTSLTVPFSSISQIDKSILLAIASHKQPNEIVFDVIRQPTHGSLILESLRAVNNGRTVMPSNFFVSRFTQAHVNAGQVQYLHNGAHSTRDSIVFNVSVEKQIIGPYTLLINIVDDKVELSVSNITVISGSNKTINSDVLYVGDQDDVEFRILSAPECGWIVRDEWNLINISTIRQFNVQELTDHRIHYVNNPFSRDQRDTFTVAACTIGTQQCTVPKQVTVLVRYHNLYVKVWPGLSYCKFFSSGEEKDYVAEPELLRNEIMKIWNMNRAPITNKHLFSQDDDTPTEQVRYLINQPLNGYVAHVNIPSKAITNFSQAEINKSEIIFVKNEGITTAGGFSFLVSDGLHQIGPEWFTVESSQGFKVTMDTNSRLIVPPGKFPVVIGPDLLKVQIPDAKPSEIVYKVTKVPRYGNLLLSGVSVQQFTQEDINQRRLVYKGGSNFLDEWTKKDQFLFKVFINDSVDEPTIDEHRFKISITYAALPSHRLHEFIQLHRVVVSRGGSVAINESHVNLGIIRKHFHGELLVQFSRKPRYGQLDVLNSIVKKTTLMKLLDLLTGRSLIYRHQKTETLVPDEILFYILSKNDVNRRTNRLRVILPVTVIPQKDPFIKIKKFPDRIKLTAGNNYSLSPEVFQAAHPEMKPTDLEYRLLQTGSNGVKFLMRSGITRLFTQDDVNNGKIQLSHQQQLDVHDNIDVVVFQVGSHIRALIIDILPLSFSLENHSDVEYTQGKTYVLLNRTHFGAKSNGDRSKIMYKITKSPENGTLYWVEGEKEANTFTQRDIDEERVLYAQLNMQAFQDRFEFKVENELNETIQSTSYVRVLPILNPQTLVADGNSVALITDTHLNASILQGSTPRFFVTESPRFGRFVLSTNVDQSVEFFTYNDIVNNGLFYVPNQTDVMILDFAELELNADEIQPARFRFDIEIYPSIIINYISSTDTTANRSVSPDLSHSSIVPINEFINYYVLIILFALIIGLITIVIIFRRHSSHLKQIRVVNAQKRRELNAKTKADLEKKSDLLSTTVYATIGRNRFEPSEKRSERSLQTFDGSKHHASLTPIPTSQRTQSRPLSGESLNYRALNVRNTSELNRSKPDQYHSTRLKDNQYWV